MTTEVMNIHEALSEIKTIDSRIENKISNAVFVKSNKHSNKKINGKTIDDFKNDMKSECQSIEDLIKRRNAIKRAVVLSNAKTVVNVNGEEFTVAEAIDMKNNGVVNYKFMLEKMTRQWAITQNEVERNSGESLERKAEEYVKSMLMASKAEKADVAWIQSMREDYIKNNTFDIIDPNDVWTKIKNLDDWISGFLSKVDSALSTSNAITTIEVSY